MSPPLASPVGVEVVVGVALAAGVPVAVGVGVALPLSLAAAILRSVSLVSLTLRSFCSVGCGADVVRTGAEVATGVGAGATALSAGRSWATAALRSARGVFVACWTSTAPAVTIAAAARPAAAFPANALKPTCSAAPAPAEHAAAPPAVAAEPAAALVPMCVTRSFLSRISGPTG